MNIFDLLGHAGLWAGSSEALRSLESALAPETFAVLTQNARASDDEEDDNSVGYEVIDGTAIITVSGALVNSSKWYLKYIGAVGYPHLQSRLQQAYEDRSVKDIILNVSSPGGAVSGVAETAEMIRAVRKAKPMRGYAGSTAASAGYWLLSQAKDITVGPLAALGSIGVVSVHMEQSKMLEDMGIKATVIREGERKMLVNQYEPLTEAAIEEIKAGMAVAKKQFVKDIAAGLGVAASAIEPIADGRVLWGAEAVKAGLASRIGSLSATLANRSNVVDNPAGRLNSTSSGETEMGTAVITPQENGGDQAPASASAQAKPDATAATISQLAVDLAAARLDATKAQGEVAVLSAQVTALTGTIEKMKAIVGNSLDTMSVALGGAKVSAGLEVEALLAKHDATSTEFQAKFPAGGRAALPPEEKPTQKADSFDHSRRLAAVSFNTKGSK